MCTKKISEKNNAQISSAIKIVAQKKNNAQKNHEKICAQNSSAKKYTRRKKSAKKIIHKINPQKKQ